MNGFSKMLAFLLLVVSLFYTTVMYFSQKNDMITQTYLETTVSEFVDYVRDNGKITRKTYDIFLSDLSASNHIYGIVMEYNHKSVDPVYDNNGNFINTVRENNNIYYEDEILEAIYGSSGQFLMTKGDFITIKIVNKDKTLATRIIESITKRKIPTEQLMVTDGGMILDENY